jgi:CRISP-associated protein Cas1
MQLLSEIEDAPEILIVDMFGAYLTKHSERLQIKVKGSVVREAPLLDLRQVVVTAYGASLSTEAIRACCDRGIPIAFLSRSGAPYARLDAPALLGTVRTRRAQLLAYDDERSVSFARESVAAKLANQRNLLRYAGKYRRQSQTEAFQKLLDAAIRIDGLATTVAALDADSIDELRPTLMNLEAQAAKTYWDAFGLLLPAGAWLGRQHRGADDVPNACLNYGYGILYSQIEAALARAGLDSYAGFLHADRAGKPSMVFDLIEEFRQPVVDRAVLALLNRGEPITMEDGRLDESSRRLVADRVLARLDTAEPYRRKRQTLRAIIALQAQRLAAMLRGDGTYEGYVMRW